MGGPHLEKTKSKISVNDILNDKGVTEAFNIAFAQSDTEKVEKGGWIIYQFHDEINEGRFKIIMKTGTSNNQSISLNLTKPKKQDLLKN